MHRLGLAPAALLLVVAGAGLVACGDTETGSAQCAAVFTLSGRAYSGFGGLVRRPRVSERVGTAEAPACDDVNPGGEPDPGYEVDAYAFRDIDPGIAVYANGSIWVADLETMPRDVAETNRTLPCSVEGEFDVTGFLVGLDPDRVDKTNPPYDATFVADGGSGLPFDYYDELTLPIRVTRGTTGGTDPAVVDTVGNGKRSDATFVCRGATYVVTSIRPG